MQQMSVAWRGEDDPSRVHQAFIRLGRRGMSAHGTSITDAYALAWRLDAEDDWRTRALDVTVHGEGWHRSLVLTRSSHGAWKAEVHGRGDAGLPPAGIVDGDAFAAALDCDLGLCPATNTMPIRRLGLPDAGVPATPLVMALVDVPSLQVVRSEQIYSSAGPGRVGFRSGDFRAELTVDEDGLVIDYPGLARRIR